MVDTTFHVSDLLVVIGGFCSVLWWVGRRIARAVTETLHGIDRRLTAHDTLIAKYGRRMDDVELTVEQHHAVLQRLGFTRDASGAYSFRHTEGL